MSEVTLESQLIEIIKDEEMAENIKLAKIDMLIRLGVDVNALYGAKSLLKLTKDNNLKKVAELLENNGAKDVFDEEIAKELGVKLIELCTNGEKKDVEELIDMGADINQKNKYGNTALMRASYWGNKEVVELLIQNGADVNVKSNGGSTALMYASCKGRKEIVELLIQNGADVNAKTNGGSTALMKASFGGHKEIAVLLIQNGADVNQKNNEGQNAMMVAYDNGTKKAIINAVKKRNEKENGGSFFSKIKRRLGIDM